MRSKEPPEQLTAVEHMVTDRENTVWIKCEDKDGGVVVVSVDGAMLKKGIEDMRRDGSKGIVVECEP